MLAICYAMRDSGRSVHVAKAMVAGFQRHGIPAELSIGVSLKQGDIAVGYGWIQKRVFDSYAARGGRFLYVDMGYWHRKPVGNPRGGYHKVSLDAWCPSAHMGRGLPSDRFSQLNIPLASRGLGQAIILAGMSAKSAIHHGLCSEQWERDTLLRLQAISKRAVYYRPKPSWLGKKPISGTEFDGGERAISERLQNDAHALVTHHSNAAIDALVAGVPYYCEAGVARPLSAPTIEALETAEPPADSERRQLLADIAYCQWTPDEMRSGACWDYFKGLVK